MNPVRRIIKEYEELENWRYADIQHITTKVGRRKQIRTVCITPLFEAEYEEANIRQWLVKIIKPNLDNEFLEVNINFPDNFPFSPPKFMIRSEFSHSCIDRRGKINIINDNNWSPALTVGACLLIITSSLFPDWELDLSCARQQRRTEQIKFELIMKTHFDDSD